MVKKNQMWNKTLRVSSKKYNINCEISNDIKTAVMQIKTNYMKNKKEVALLSPAAASLDQFTSYKHRGIVFKENVNI